MKTLKRHGLEGRIVILRNKGLSFREIGEKIGMSKEHTYKLYHDSKKKLKIQPCA